MKVGYSKTYPIASNGTWEKIWIEDDTQDQYSEDEIRKRLYSLKKQVENFHFESNKAAEKQAEITEEPKSKLSQVERIIADIQTCKDPIILGSYSIIAKNNPEIQKAFDKKLKSLQP